MTAALGTRPLDIFLVAGEASGDALGGPLMAALKARLSGNVRFRGVGGASMQAEGLQSLYPMEDLTVMGFDAVLAKLPLIFRRLRQTAAAVAATAPDLLILIDSPDFNMRLGKRVRRALPDLAIVKYVSPTVWAWRPGRAAAMRPVFDHVLALFPFEPAVHEKLGGPPCTYVGHPLLERLHELRPSAADEAARAAEPPVVLVLPGSRRTEIKRLSPVFGETLARLAEAHRGIEFVLPTLPYRAAEVASAIESWRVKPKVVVSEAEKLSAFRRARAALAASGTVTLELALAHVPTVAGYRVSALEAPILRRVIRSPSVILPNLILGENVVPEFHQETCTAENLFATLLPLLDGPARQRQLEAFARLDDAMAIGDEHPSERAARVAMEVYEGKTRSREL
ncbi:MAG: lipid-A-disaccharide synthase [Bradyrhizobiaceae bacterium]|nr:lipid-A-disaccharide synthase [Bradyrhizobiaceae bacterium]